MTYFRSVLFVALTAVVGCSAEAASTADSAAADTASSPTIAEQTIVKGDLAVGATTKVGYDPNEYVPTKIDGVPYLAWAVDTKAAALSVDVSGDFPGTPDVLVTDSQFNVLGKATGEKLADGTAAASLSVQVPAGQKMLLVRDEIWVRPMQFDITVAQ